MRFDFPTIMVLLCAVSGAIWAFDAAVLARRRKALAIEASGGAAAEIDAELLAPSRIVEYARSFFPVFLIVFVLRSFLVEPFRIPSGSMMPTLLIGDFILVNKFDYGIRIPVLDRKVVEIGAPERGDVVVFRYPEDPSTPFIKRVVGLPGDRIAYYGKTLYINGQEAKQEDLGAYIGTGKTRMQTGATLKEETLGTVEHQMLVQTGMPTVEGKAVVPEGHYFVLGDNRDNSRDSRYWGTVPDELLIGKAFTIWMHFTLTDGFDWSRIGRPIE